MPSAIPSSLHDEHAHLHDALARARNEPGELGEAARLLGRLLDAHMEKEERHALKPLALLPELARGKLSREMGEVLEATDWLERHLDDLIAEHGAIVAALGEVVRAAGRAGRVDYAEPAQRLLHHARLEEEVLYPAAALVGRYLKVRLGAR